MQRQNRRRFLIGTGAAVAGTVGLGSTSVFGASGGPQLVFTEINAEEEYLVVKNVSGEEIDLSGYVVDFGYMDDDEGDEQKGTIAQGTTISAGDTLKISPDAEQGEAGVTTDREYVMPNNEEEVYAILSPEGKVVARSDKEKYVGVPETTTTTTTTEEETTTTTKTEETTTEDETTTTEEKTTTTAEEETTTDKESGSSSDQQTTTESDEGTTTTSDGSTNKESDEEDC